MIEHEEDYKRLINILEKLFQLDQADLDFGIYRIMNQKREEVSDFLENNLLSQIKETLEVYADEDKDKLKKELETLEKTLRDAGVDVDSNQKVLTLRKQLGKTDVTDLQNNVFSHLTNFFKRYYKEGDFISQRRYKDNVYAIPYQGEEVKLHWANHDQYYIKTSEYFKNYRFKLRNGKLVNFELREASTEQNNNKAQNGERKFKLAEERIYSEDENTLTIYFTYAPMSKKTKQKILRKQAYETLKEELPSGWITELFQPNPTENNKDRTELEKHLKDYTARNTFDYFIHKDLGKFLRRELDFYIKNDILHIDDIDLDKQESYQESLQIIKAFKKVALKIIDFLAQLENFQKKLWLKKKFVLQSDYCITLDRVDEEFYENIAGNDQQRQEWVNLYAIDELDNYSEPLTVGFLRENPFLMIDTRFFEREWKYTLLATFNDLDAQTDGLMLNSENFQALKLISEKYSSQIDAIYIDPPYNTDASEIIYKNGYKKSSWNTLIRDRIQVGKKLLKKDGVQCTTIDDYQKSELEFILKNIFGEQKTLGVSPIRNNPSGRPIPTGFAISHEYGIYTGNSNESLISKFPRTEEQNKRYNQEDEEGIYMWELLRKRGSDSERSDSPKAYFPIYLDQKSNNLRLPNMMYDKEETNWIVEEEPKDDEIKLLPIDEDGVERRWRWGYDRISNSLDQFKVEKKNNIFTVYYKYRPPEGAVPVTLWKDSKYSATEHGTGKLKPLFKGYNPFSFPKSIYAVRDSIYISGAKKKNSVTLDYFAGSGTTGQAVIDLNRDEKNGNRKYIMVEMGEYFDSVTKPRIQKVVYSKKWKDGKPVCREGISHMFKYLRLESYEDTLNNLNLQRSGRQQELLENEELKEEYMLHYMLDVEARDSLLATEVFIKPFGYTIAATQQNERIETDVDLVDTFNYLIGLKVEHMELNGGYVVVVGQNNDGEQILIIWRNLEEHDNEALEDFFKTIAIPTEKKKLDRIYINGDHNLRTIRTAEESWNVQLIEEEFHKRMFEKKGL